VKAYAKDLLLDSKGKLSNRAIGSMACLDAKTIQVVREELEASEEIHHTAKRYSRDGRSQDVSDKDERKGKPIDKDAVPDWRKVAEEEEEADEEEDASLPLVRVDSYEVPQHRPDYVYEVNKDCGRQNAASGRCGVVACRRSRH
jgi:hypothetical protein